MKSKYCETMIEVAKLFAKNSYAKRLKVGSVLCSPDGRILASSYNGTPAGFISNKCEIVDSFKCPKCNIKETFTPNLKNEMLFFNSDNDLDVIEYSNYFKRTLTDNNIICNRCNSVFNSNELIINYKTRDIVLHSEENLICFCAKHGISTNNNYLFITHAPCIKCSRMIISAGISKVFYKNEYRSNDGLELLKYSNIEVIKL